MRIGFIGTGAMASAIARGAVAAGFSGSDLMFADRHRQAAEDLADELGGVALASNRQVAEQSDLLVLAVKPNVQSEVIREIRESVLFAKELCVISIAAGRTTDQIISDFGAAIPSGPRHAQCQCADRPVNECPLPGRDNGRTARRRS